MSTASSKETTPNRVADSKIWYRDPFHFIGDTTLTHFYPSSSDPLVAQLNAIMRFAVYFTLVVLVVRRDINALFIFIAAGLVTYVVNETQESREELTQDRLDRLGLKRRKDAKVVAARARQRAETCGKPGALNKMECRSDLALEGLQGGQGGQGGQGDQEDSGLCVKPTRDNPFMNMSLVDRADFPNRPAACDPTHADTREEIDDKFEHNLYRDFSDVYNRKSNSRQFYTLPVTTATNDQTAFARWCYGTGPTCKEGNGAQCHLNINQRLAGP